MTAQLTGEDANNAAISRELGKALKAMADRFRESLHLAQERYNFATSKLNALEPLLEAVERKRSSSKEIRRFLTLDNMCHAYHSLAAMMDAHRKVELKNLMLTEKLLEVALQEENNPEVWRQFDPLGYPNAGESLFTFVEEDMDYLEARIHMNYSVGMFTWMDCLDGIDAVLRASMNERATNGESAEDEEVRISRGNALRKKMMTQPELMRLVLPLGSELQETWACLDWASGNLQRLDALYGEAKQQLLQDPEWMKLISKVNLLAILPLRAMAHPELMVLFPRHEDLRFPTTP